MSTPAIKTALPSVSAKTVVPERLQNEVQQVLITKQQIARRVRFLATDIARDFD